MQSNLRRGAFLAAALLALCAIVACDDDEGLTSVNLDEGDEVYEFTGRVLSFPDRTPLPGASWTILTTGESGVADGQGVFHVKGLSVGTHQVVATAPGHAVTRYNLFLESLGKAADRHAHRDIDVVEMSATLEMRVYEQEEGTPVAGVVVAVTRALVSQDPMLYTTIELPTGVVSAETDTNGIVVIPNLPASQVSVTITPPGDPQVYAAVSQSPRLAADATTSATVVLREPGTGTPQVVSTNVPPPYNGNRLTDGAVWFVYNMEMDVAAQATSVILRQDNPPYLEIPVTAVWTSPVRLEIRPQAPLDITNMDYDLELTLKSAAGTPFSYYHRFYWVTSGHGGAGGDCEDMVTDLAVAPSQLPIDYDTRSVLLSWTAVPCADGYRVFARDDRNNTDWILIKIEPNDYEYGTVNTSCLLPPIFDRYQVDDVQTPFAGIDVSLCVVPLAAAHPTAGAPHAVITVGDVTAPSIAAPVQTGGSFAPVGGPSTLEFTVQFSEFIGAGTADPLIVVTETGGDPAYALDPADAIWTWQVGRKIGHCTFQVPAGANGSGDAIQFTFTDLVDLSGNTHSGETSTNVVTIAAWGGFFDFESSPQGWTATGEGWEWGSPAIGPGQGHEGGNCWGTSLYQQYGNNWYTELRSPLQLVCPENPRLSFWCWFQTDYYDDYVRLFIVTEGGSQTEIANFHGSGSAGWQLRTYPLLDYAGQAVQIMFRFTSDASGIYDGFFLDDLEFGCD